MPQTDAKTCSKLDVEFLNEWSQYRRALQELRQGDKWAAGRAKALHLKLQTLLEQGRAAGCRVENWEAYNLGNWEERVRGQLPF